MAYPSKTYKIDLETQRIVGTIDDRLACQQFIEKTLSTDKYVWDYYDQNFGNELRTLIGKSKGYIMAQFPTLVDRCLLTDDRIVKTHDYEYYDVEGKSDCVEIRFWITTIYSEEQYTKMLDI